MIDYALIIVPCVAFLAGRLACPIVRRAALATGFVDRPDRKRKLQEAPIPLGGGLAVWIAMWVGTVAGLMANSSGLNGPGGASPPLVPLAIASALILVIGLVDDRFGMRGLHKLAGQVVSASILVGMGLRIESIQGFGFSMELGSFAGPATIAWIVLVVNAFNLIDGMDGFCAGIASVALMAIAFLACWSGRPGVALISLALAGGLAAFLKDNLPPARIYLGDAGSMTVGLVISALSIEVCSGAGGRAVSAPLLLALLALPLLDVGTALGRRWLTGRSLFIPDRGHIHHCLRSRVGNTASALGIGVGLAALVAGSAALARTRGVDDVVSSLSMATLIVVLVGTNLFGGAECRLLAYRLVLLGRRLIASRSGEMGAVRQECHFRGVKDWSSIWDEVTNLAERTGCRRLELAIDVAALGENYHGIWNLPAATTTADRATWCMVHDLEVAGRHAGTIKVVGYVDESQLRPLEHVELIVRGLQDRLEREFHREPDPRDGVSAAADGRPSVTQLPSQGVSRLIARKSEL